MSEQNKKRSVDDIMANSCMENIEGWWEAWMNGEHHQYVFIRLDLKFQRYVLDVAGQSRINSEELWRYKGGDWMMIRAAKTQLK